MIHWDKGKIIEIQLQNNNLQIVKVNHSMGESRAIHFLQFNSPLQVGEEVYLNRTANTLQLGTGGYDFVVIPTSASEKIVHQDNGHIMKLRYTPYQFSVKSVEEESSKYHETFTSEKMLDGLPVVIGELHSMLPIFVSVYRQLEWKKRKNKKKIVYIMTDGGALPINLSNHVSLLKELGWIQNTITIGNSFGGDLEAINIYTALLAAKYVLQADLVVVMMGPGIVGTGTWLGHTGIEQGIIGNAVYSLGGMPISILRVNNNDSRERHHGISHHSLSTLNYVSLVKNIIPFPDYIKETQPHIYNSLYSKLKHKHQLVPIHLKNGSIKEYLLHYPKKITTMGRTINEEPLFFAFVASASFYLLEHLHK